VDRRKRHAQRVEPCPIDAVKQRDPVTVAHPVVLMSSRLLTALIDRAY
jgi:hypothetical protein